MKRMTKISIAVACALGVSAAFAQTVQRGDATVSNADKAAQTTPIQIAQAGGTSTGATAGGATATVGFGTTLVLVGAAVAAVAISADDGTAATQH